jgi:LmbE family N-acetylglucosaminyl deacetylase
MVEIIGDHDIGIDALKRVLIIAPHPDDEVLGCGGVISSLKEVGLWVGVLFITKGEKGFLNPAVRMEEALAVKKLLGYDIVEFWDYPDGNTRDYKKNVKESLKSFLLKEEVDLALCPAVYDFHPDHKTLGEVCFELHEELYPKRFAFYSVYTNLLGNFNVNVSKHIQKLKECLNLYKSSIKEVPEIIEASLIYRKFNACILRRKESYFESYLLLKRDWNSREFVSYVLGEAFARGDMFHHYTEVKHIHHIIGYANYLEEKIRTMALTLDKYAQLEEQYIELVEKSKRLERELDAIKSSKFYKIMKGYHKVKDKLLPQSTILRKIYDRLMGNI